MKVVTIRVIDEADEPIIQRLVKLGMSRGVAEVIAYLDHIEESTTKDIERGTRRRFTDVSRSLRYLRKKGWVCETRHTKTINYRDIKYFRNSLALEIWEIIDELEKMAIRRQHMMG